MKLIISNEFKEDITRIYNYIAKDSIKYANETVNNIYLRITELEDFPYLGRYVPELNNKKYRELLYKNYRIIYNVSENQNNINIHFVVHSRRNFKTIYKNYFKSK